MIVAQEKKSLYARLKEANDAFLGIMASILGLTGVAAAIYYIFLIRNNDDFSHQLKKAN